MPDSRIVFHVYGGVPKKRGSLEEYFLSLTHRLEKIGYKTFFSFTIPPPDNLLEAYKECGAEIVLLRTTQKYLDIPLILDYWGLFRKIRPAVVNVHFGRTGVNALIAAWLAGVRKRVWTKHSIDPLSYKEKIPWPKRWVHGINYQAFWATDVIAVSRAVERELARHHIQKNVRQFYLGINLDRFSSGKNNRADIPSIPVSPGQPIVSCISQARPEKGIEVLIRAIGAIKDEPDCPRLLIVGGGPLTEKLKEVAAQLNIANRIEFCGVRNNVEDYIAISLFTVLPSLEDAAPLAILESFAGGKPVIASNVGGIPEFVVENKNGVLVSPGDFREMAGAILKMCMNKEILRELSIGALESAAKYNVSEGVEKTITVYRER